MPFYFRALEGSHKKAFGAATPVRIAPITRIMLLRLAVGGVNFLYSFFRNSLVRGKSRGVVFAKGKENNRPSEPLGEGLRGELDYSDGIDFFDLYNYRIEEFDRKFPLFKSPKNMSTVQYRYSKHLYGLGCFE